MDRYLRSWRQDALNKGQHDAAIYIGDKVLALSNSDADAFWLAQVHFSNTNYTRALALLSRKDLIARSLSCRYLASHCYIKQGRYDQALDLLGQENPINLVNSLRHNARRKLAHVNGNGLGKHVTHRGKSGRERIEYSEERERDRDQEKELKFQAGMCYLRGLCWQKRNAFDKAKECLKTAVRIDVQCFEAFDMLMSNSLMSPAEEIEFLQELDFDAIRTDEPSQAQEAAHLTKLLYTTRLSKYSSPKAMTEATENLATHYNLADNPDLLLTRAETLFTQCRFHEALAITTRILNTDVSPDLADADTHASLGHSPALYPLHLAALYETNSITTLFHLSHTLSQNAPHESYTYLAIATYYLATSRIPLARRFFSKASLLDPHSASAWIGFAHTFAAEGEHDQAIAAYSTASRLFQGSHLPSLFLGMQHLALNNMTLAWEYCIGAFVMSSGVGTITDTRSEEDAERATELIFHSPQNITGDPLVVNELAVILYHQANLPLAATLFKRALYLASDLSHNMQAWVAVRANLAHAYRRMGMLNEALTQFDECLRQLTGGSSAMASMNQAFGGLNIGLDLIGASASSASSGDMTAQRNLLGSIHTSRGLVLLSLMDRTRDAVEALHEAVRVLGDAGGGGLAGTLLNKAMEVWSLEESLIDDNEDEDHDDDDDGDEQGDEDGTQDDAADEILLEGPGGKRKNHLRGPNEPNDFFHAVGQRLDDDADELLDVALYNHR